MLKAQSSFTQWWPLAQKVYQHYLFESSQLPFEGGTAITSGLQVPKVLKNLSAGVWVRIQELVSNIFLPTLSCFWSEMIRHFLIRALVFSIFKLLCISIVDHSLPTLLGQSPTRAVSQAPLAVQGSFLAFIYSFSKYLLNTCCVPERKLKF